MKLFDLNLRGTNHTLGTIVDAEDHFMFRDLILYLCSVTENEDAELPTTFELSEKGCFSKDTVCRLKLWLISSGYCITDKDTYIFTEKALDVFNKMFEAQSSTNMCMYA